MGSDQLILGVGVMIKQFTGPGVGTVTGGTHLHRFAPNKLTTVSIFMTGLTAPVLKRIFGNLRIGNRQACRVTTSARLRQVRTVYLEPCFLVSLYGELSRSETVDGVATLASPAIFATSKLPGVAIRVTCHTLIVLRLAEERFTAVTLVACHLRVLATKFELCFGVIEGACYDIFPAGGTVALIAS